MSVPRFRSALAANLLLLVASTAVALVSLALVEGVLRLVHVGAPDASRASRLKYQQIQLPILEPGERADGSPVLRSADPRLPRQSLLRVKPANGLRVATFGGSATAGLGFSPNVTFARELERMLARAYPERHVEVINLGVVALASRQVGLLVADVARRYEPDLLVVYSGNNEFLEIHADKYASAHANPLSRAGDLLRKLNLYRALQRAVRGPPRTPSLADQDFSHEDLQLTQDAIIREIETTPAEIARTVDEYEANIDEMVEVARATRTPLLLMTVASNWRWRGRSDLPEDWLAELLGGEAASSPEAWSRARALLDGRVKAAAAGERHEWLYKRAVVAEAMGDLPGARADYRAAMNADPHLRRALDVMADRVRRVGERRGVPVFDVIPYLAQHSEDGIVGFDVFYDYVHFTPRGALLVAAGTFQAALESGLLPPAPRLSSDAYLREREARLAALSQDPLDVGEWMGFGAEPGRIHDRDLWKYDRFLKQLDERLAERPDDVLSLVYRGNARFFELGGAAGAERDYRAALALAPGRSEIQANLEKLLAEGAN